MLWVSIRYQGVLSRLPDASGEILAFLIGSTVPIQPDLR